MSENPFGLTKVKHIIAVSSCKGGVGKSTVACALAWELAHRGFKVGLLDADIYGPSLPTLLGLGKVSVQSNEFKLMMPLEYQGLKLMSFGFLLGDAPAVMRGPIVTRYIQQLLLQTDWGQLDYLILDMPPGTGDVQLTITQSVKLTGAVIVTTHHGLSLVDVARGILMFEKVNVPILGVIENMAYFQAPDTGKKYYVFGEQKAGALSARFGVKTLVEIPLLAQLTQGLSEYKPNVYLEQAANELLKSIDIALKSQEILADVDVVEGEVILRFTDGRQLASKVYDLRMNCQCALCVSEVTGKSLIDPAKIPTDITIKEILPLGNYAVGITFSDGHASGIFPYNLFKKHV